MKHNHFYCLKYSDYCHHLHFYTHNVSANMSYSLPQVFHVKLGNLYKALY